MEVSVSDKPVVPPRFLTDKEMRAVRRSNRRWAVAILSLFAIFMVSLVIIAVNSLPEEQRWTAWGVVGALVIGGLSLFIGGVKSHQSSNPKASTPTPVRSVKSK